jgi:hypothetical protein
MVNLVEYFPQRIMRVYVDKSGIKGESENKSHGACLEDMFSKDQFTCGRQMEIYNAVNIVTVAVRELTCIKKLTKI